MNTALKILEDLAFEDKKKKYPDQPYLVKTKYSDKSANALTKSIIAFVRLNGGQAERISNTGRVVDGRKTYTDALGHRRTIGNIQWIPGTGTQGTADISATIDGRSVKIEVKHGRDRQSEAQKKYQADVERSGGVYYVSKNFDDFYNWFINFPGE